MHLIDTHAHLSSRQLRDETAALVHRAEAAEVRGVVSIGTDLEDSAHNLQLAAQFPGVIFPTVGIHPTSAHEVGEGWLDALRDLAKTPGVAALGEMGLDYYHPPQDGSPVEKWHALQADRFQAQLDLAVELSLPVVIHQRESSAAVLEMIRPYAGKLKAVFHCFVGDVAEARGLLELGFHISFTGVATYKNAAEVAETAAWAPLDRCMVETDSPYLSPVPHRGQRNEPAYVRHTAEFIAHRRGMTLEAFAEATTRTARGFFLMNPDTAPRPSRSN